MRDVAQPDPVEAGTQRHDGSLAVFARVCGLKRWDLDSARLSARGNCDAQATGAGPVGGRVELASSAARLILTPDRAPDRVPNRAPDRVPDRLSERVPERVPGWGPNLMPNRAPGVRPVTDRKTGDALGLNPIERFHRHGTAPVSGPELGEE